jgi:hypothetical protein
VWHTPRLRAAMALAALVNLCAFPLSGGLMPYIARDVFGLDQQGLGWLVASYAAGRCWGRWAWGPSARGCPGAHHGAGLRGLVPVPAGPGAAHRRSPLAMALYVAAGLNQSLSMLALSIILLRTSHERFRGRVMGVRMLAIYTLPIGLLAAGPIVTAIGLSHAGAAVRRPRAEPAGRHRAWSGATTCCRTRRRPMPCAEGERVSGGAWRRPARACGAARARPHATTIRPLRARSIPPMDAIDEQTLEPGWVRWRHDFHRFPETGFAEHRTPTAWRSCWQLMGLEVHRGIGGTGVVASLRWATGRA